MFELKSKSVENASTSNNSDQKNSEIQHSEKASNQKFHRVYPPRGIKPILELR